MKEYTICKKCKGEQWCRIDQAYLEMYGNCRDCDKKLWENGRMELKEATEREKKAWDKVKSQK